MKRRGPPTKSHASKAHSDKASGKRTLSRSSPGGSRPPGSHGKPPRPFQERVRGGDGDRLTAASFGKGRWVIGIHSCEEAVRVRPKAIAEALLRPKWQDSAALREISDVLRAKNVQIRERSMEQLNQFGAGHQGVALQLTESPEIDWLALAAPGQRIVLILDGIEDPHNLGSMIRTGWLAGVSGILIPEDRAVGLTPSVCKVASGGAEHVPVEAHVNFGSVTQRLKELGFWIYGLAEKGKSRPWDLKLPEKVAWVIGSEGSGMRIPTERLCDELVRLPQVTSGSSYNAAIAAAFALGETCRQFGKPE